MQVAVLSSNHWVIGPFRQISAPRPCLSGGHQRRCANGRTPEAVQYGLECYRLGQAVARGGILIDALVGIAVEGIAVDRLASVRHLLDGASAARLSAVYSSSIESAKTLKPCSRGNAPGRLPGWDGWGACNSWRVRAMGSRKVSC